MYIIPLSYAGGENVVWYLELRGRENFEKGKMLRKIVDAIATLILFGLLTFIYIEIGGK